MKRLAPGAAGWIMVGIVVAAAEAADSRTMSGAFRAALEHPVAGPFVYTGYGLLTAHLFGLLPRRYDPLHQLAKHTFARNRAEYRGVFE